MSSIARRIALTKASEPPKAVDVLDSDIAKAYAHIHPLLILSVYFFNLSSIIADPVSALSTLLLPVSALQIAYSSLCLPATGASDASPSTLKAGARKKQGQGKSDGGIGSKVVPALLSFLLAAVLGTPVTAAALVLFGAPVTTHIPHTLLCAAHLSLLASIPLIYVHGVDGQRWRDLVGLAAPIDEVVGAALGALLGAWLGAVPIPLDWDREWQKWPVTIVTGAYAGWAVGKFLGGLLLKGFKIRFE